MQLMAVQIDQEIDESRCVGQAGRYRRAGHFVAGRQNDKHEKGIQYYVQDTSHRHSETGFLCRTDGAHKMSAQDISHGRDRSDDHCPEHVVVDI